MALFRIYHKIDPMVGVWKIEETIDELRNLFKHFELYEEGLSRFTSEKRKLEWLAVRALLKELLYGEEKEIAYHPSGRPYLVDGSGGISFSHTKGYVAVAYSPYEDVAIDIEHYSDRVRKVAHKFIRPDEQPSIQRAEDELTGLLLHWCAKETLYKLIDTPGIDFLKDFLIFPCTPLEGGSVKGYVFLPEKEALHYIDYMTTPDYMLTYATIPWPRKR